MKLIDKSSKNVTNVDFNPTYIQFGKIITLSNPINKLMKMKNQHYLL